MNKQSLFTILLTVLMSMTGAKAFAHDIAVANDDGVVIYYKWSNYNTELSVSYRGTSFYEYSNEYFGNVVIPESVIYEGNTYSVTSIGEFAFAVCSDLTSITIPNSVISIGQSAFYGTAWYDNQPDGLVYAGKVAYQYKGEMPANTHITIKEGTVGIANRAFQSCSGLSSITIPNSVISIGPSAFDACTGLISVTIPNSVTTIGSSAFYKCSGLTSVTIGNSVTTIEDYAFKGCSGLTSVTFGNSVTFIGLDAFYGTAWYNNQPDGLVYAGKVAYQYKGEMPANTHITIKDGTLGIAFSAFAGCSGLTSISIPNSVTIIGAGAFWNCSGLTSITIPCNVTEIFFQAFAQCTALESVKVMAATPPLAVYQAFGEQNNEAFDKYDIPLYVPEASLEDYKNTSPWNKFQEIVGMDGGDDPGTLKCAKPTIAIADGQIQFSCETEGVEFQYTISNSGSTSQNVSMTQNYTIAVYATKEGYEDSEVTTAELVASCDLVRVGDMNQDGKLTITDVINLMDVILTTP